MGWVGVHGTDGSARGVACGNRHLAQRALYVDHCENQNQMYKPLVHVQDNRSKPLACSNGKMHEGQGLQKRFCARPYQRLAMASRSFKMEDYPNLMCRVQSL